MMRRKTKRLGQVGRGRALGLVGLAVTSGAIAALFPPACGQGTADDAPPSIGTVRQAEGTPSPVACEQTSDTMPVFAATDPMC